MMERTFSAFISHSSKDDGYVVALIPALARFGIDVWDDRLLRVSQNWLDIVEQRIREAPVFLLAITPNSYNSGPVEKEIQLAVYYQKPIVPILLQKLDSWERWQTFGIRDITYIDLLSWDPKDPISEGELQKLIDGINIHREKWFRTVTRRILFGEDATEEVKKIEEMVLRLGEQALPQLTQKLFFGTVSLFRPPLSTAVIWAIAAIGGDYARVALEFSLKAYHVQSENMPTIIEALGHVGTKSTVVFLNAMRATYQNERPELVKIATNAINRIGIRTNYADRPDIQPRDI